MIKEQAYLRLIGEASFITYVLFFKKHNKKHNNLFKKDLCTARTSRREYGAKQTSTIAY
jgi:hypothetical protein